MTSPLQMQLFEAQLSSAVAECFPGIETSVSYWGSGDGIHKWRVAVKGKVLDLTQGQAALAVGGQRVNFRQLFGY